MTKGKKLHSFQYLGAYKLYSEERFLLADDMGMFKTAQAIFANNKFRDRKKNLRTLIICPPSVREHWQRELQQWAYPSGDINVIYAQDMENSLKRAKKATWTVASYHLMSNLTKDVLDYLKNIGFHHVIGDEIHNAKNPDALRTRAIKQIIDKADFVSLLSGTPIPNTISDLYVLMSMLDPNRYPFNPENGSYHADDENFRRAQQSFIQLYIDRPQEVKELLHRKMLRRLSETYIKAELPEVEMHNIEIPLSGKHLETYQSTLEKDMGLGEKMWELVRASLDPRLIDPSLPLIQSRGKSISAKYDVLDDIIEREMKKPKGKVLVFTDLKQGVVDNLEKRYSSFGAISVTGDDSGYGLKEDIRQQFQRDSATRVLISTTTMNEGVDLTAATAVVELTIADTPAKRHQRWKRSHRIGEIKKDKMDVYTLISTITGPQPSIDEAFLERLEGKEKIVDYMLSGIRVSIEELINYSQNNKTPRVVRAITSPSRAVLKEFLPWRGLGSEGAKRRLARDPDMSKFIARLYPAFSMAKNAADVYIPIIREIEKEKSLETKVDIGCGPGMLGYFLDEPTIGVDINPDMIEEGKKLYPKNKLYVGVMSNLPLDNNIADLVVCSLAFQMNAPKTERAKALLEISRILKYRGYAIITLPGNYMIERDRTRFKKVLDYYGYQVNNREFNLGKSSIDLWVLNKHAKPMTDELFKLRWKGDPGRKA